MSVPRWTLWLLRRVCEVADTDDLVGDLEEAHHDRVVRRGRVIAAVLTTFEALDLARAVLWERARGRGAPVSLIDFKLGARMLFRYPGLTVLGGLAMAFGISAGTASFELMRQLAAPELPFEDGERIVGMWMVDAEASEREPRILHDFLTWRDELHAVEHVAAYRTIGRNVAVGESEAEPSAVAETSAAAFRVAGVQPLLGRTLIDQDERFDAPMVVVLGHGAWQTMFDGDANVVGRSLRLGDDAATVVGVMPEGYAFPQADLWTPLRLNPLDYPLRESPAIAVIGRLGDGATMEQAEAELSALSVRAARDQPATHARLLPRIAELPSMYFPFPGFFSPEMATANLFILAVIVLLGSNVALLMFARAAARESEIVVRSALGAGRRRIVGQLFAEALVLAAVAAVLGIAGGSLLFETGIAMIVGVEGALPFWIRTDLSAASVVYGAVLTVVIAAVAGVLPGLQATRHTSTRLRASSSGGGGARFGGIWTAVIVTQVALTVAFPAATLFMWQEGREQLEMGVEVPAHEFVVARLQGDGETWSRSWGEPTGDPVTARYSVAVQELERRLEAAPSAASVTFVDALPRVYHIWNQIELDAGAVEPPDGRGHRVARAVIRPDYFDVLGAEVVAGRPLDTRDVETGAPVVLVDEPFVKRVLGGRSPIGHLVRYVANEREREPTDEGPWYEIVGVVGDLGLETGYGRGGIYHAASPSAYPAYLVAHVRENPGDWANQLRGVAAGVDPTLQVQEVMTLEAVLEADQSQTGFWTGLAILLTAIVLLLSLASTYAVTSFTVSRRTREIGVRVALGADPIRVLRAVMRRPVLRVLAGTVAGAAFVAQMVSWGVSTAEDLGPKQFAWIAAYAVVMLGVSMLACIVPARRALAVEPRDALAADA